MRQTEYTVQDLVQDPSFLRFAKGIASVEETEEWDRWIEHTLQNRAKSKAAISEIVGFEFKNELAPDIEKQWALLYKKTAGDQKKESRRLTGRELNWIVRAVAVLILVSTVWAGSHLFSNDGMPVTQLEQLIEETMLRTAENEQKIMRFSNGSSIVLNSNSTITYSTGQVNSQTIQVFLDGEAWFVADDDPGLPGPAFSISTPNGIIEDIGTEFLVSVGDTGSRVVVQEGVVEIFPSRHQADFNPPNYKEISSYRAEKGELIEFTHENILDRRNVNTTFYTSWATGFMQLDRTSLDEFSRHIEQRYDVRTVIADAELSGITLDGAVYFRTLEDLVQSVSQVTGIPVYRSAERDTVYIGNPNSRATKTQDEHD